MLAVNVPLFTRDMYHDEPFNEDSYKEDVLGRLRKYFGKSVMEAARELGVSSIGKQCVYDVASRIMGRDKVQCKRAGIYAKIHVVYPLSPGMRQHISLPSFRFNKIKDRDWWHSDLRHLLMDYEWLFIVFENNDENPKRRLDEHIILKDAFFWKMPPEDLEEVCRVYELTREIIKNGIEIKKVMRLDGKIVKKNNLPCITDSKVCHVRPHGDPKNPEWLPNGESINQQSFWLNTDYVKGVIESRGTQPRLFVGY